jgi:hypothetical protein
MRGAAMAGDCRPGKARQLCPDGGRSLHPAAAVTRSQGDGRLRPLGDDDVLHTMRLVRLRPAAA